VQSECLGRKIGTINGSVGTNQTAKHYSWAKRWNRRQPCALSDVNPGRMHFKLSSRDWGIATRCLACWAAVRLCCSTMPTLFCNLTLCFACLGSGRLFASKAPTHFSWTNLERCARAIDLWQRQHFRGMPVSKGSKTCQLRSPAVRLRSRRLNQWLIPCPRCWTNDWFPAHALGRYEIRGLVCLAPT